MLDLIGTIGPEGGVRCRGVLIPSTYPDRLEQRSRCAVSAALEMTEYCVIGQASARTVCTEVGHRPQLRGPTVRSLLQPCTCSGELCSTRPVADLQMTFAWFSLETGHEGQFYERHGWQPGRMQISTRTV